MLFISIFCRLYHDENFTHGAFHIETSHLIHTANTCNKQLKYIEQKLVSLKEKPRHYWNGTRAQNHLVVYELGGCGFESRCSYLNFRYRACFEQGGP